MATVTKEAADSIIKINTMKKLKKGESKCMRIVKYENNWNSDSYGVIFEGDNLLAYHNSYNCHNVEIYWENEDISFDKIEGKYLILRSNNSINEVEVKKLINASHVQFMQVASYEAEDFCELMGDAYMQVKNIEFYCEELQIFKVEGNVTSKEIEKKMKGDFIGALNFNKGDFDKLKRNLYTKCQSTLGREKCMARVNEIVKNAW